MYFVVIEIGKLFCLCLGRPTSLPTDRALANVLALSEFLARSPDALQAGGTLGGHLKQSYSTKK